MRTPKFGDIAADANNTAWMVLDVHADSLTMLSTDNGWHSPAAWDDDTRNYFLVMPPRRMSNDSLTFTGDNASALLNGLVKGTPSVQENKTNPEPVYPIPGWVGTADDGSRWYVREVCDDKDVIFMTRIVSVRTVHSPVLDHQPEGDAVAWLPVINDGSGWKLGDQNIVFQSPQDALKPKLPQRTPGVSLAAELLTESMAIGGYTADFGPAHKSVTDVYAAQVTAEDEETALKACRLNEVHEWLMERYAAQVAAVQLYKQRVYAEVLYLIETGRKPTDNPEDMANFERDQYDAVCSVIEQRNRRTQ